MNCYTTIKAKIKKSKEDEIRSLVRKETIHQMNKAQMDVNAVVLTVLHETFGFGRERLLRFLNESSRLQDYLSDRYEDADLYYMVKNLKEDFGIDLKKMIYDNPEFSVTESEVFGGKGN